MTKRLLSAALACGAFAMIGTAASAQPKGKAYGYWAGKICDAESSWMGDHLNGMPYWMAFEEADYESREQCVEEHVEWLKEGNDVPDWAM